MERSETILNIMTNILKDNDRDNVTEAFNILLKLFNNITSNPSDQKFRNFKITNEALKTKVLSVKGTLQMLEILGYKKKDEEFYTFDNPDCSNIETAMDLMNKMLFNYEEYLEYNPNAIKVDLLLYDISNGMARQFSPMLLGKTIEGVWHTSIIVYGREFYFGGGICEGAPKKTPYGKPVKEIKFGHTELPVELFKEYLKDLNDKFNANTYNVLYNNCNHFTNEIANFLTGKNIPENILNQHKELYNSPMGKMILPMLEKMNDQNPQNFPNMFEDR
jgi:hypothetical protein